MLYANKGGKKIVACCNDRHEVYPKEMVLPETIEKSADEALFYLTEVPGKTKKFMFESSLYPGKFLGFEITGEVDKLILRQKSADEVDEGCELEVFQIVARYVTFRAPTEVTQSGACMTSPTEELRGAVSPFSPTMDSFEKLSPSEQAEASELQRMIAIEQQKAQFQAQVHTFTDVCWDKCVDSPGSKLDYRTETCLQSCVERFIDTTLTITNRFTQMKTSKDRYVAWIGITGCPTLEPGLGLGLLVAGSLPMGPSRAQPEMATWACLPVGSPPAGRSMRGIGAMWFG
ncbi:hypothetical protein L3Q82_019145 [Scortum barcoo]|uniref:Uncharacterized protein n=1 Tax=Scortum barcoo TaxID=214431 RepID=A0ACB8VGU0_9TELE|nr:hypothetical protein L3Q82_019145 [Scortum barcoo]